MLPRPGGLPAGGGASPKWRLSGWRAPCCWGFEVVAGGPGDDFPASRAPDNELGALLTSRSGAGEKWQQGLRWRPRSGMCESYSRSLLRVSVAQICQALGWDSVQLSACHLLTDVLQRYLQQLGRGCHRYSELCEYRAGCGRTARRVTRDTSVSPSLPRRPRGLPSAPRPEICHLLGSQRPWASTAPANSSHSQCLPCIR